MKKKVQYDEVTDLDPTAKFHRVAWEFAGLGYLLEIELSTGFKVTKFTITEPEQVAKSRGLGDTVEKAIKKATRGKVKPCVGCKKRRDVLNTLLPYKGGEDGN